MNFELTEEQKLVQKTARDFSKSELLPGAVERDISKIWPTEAIKKMADLGFMGMMVNPKWNGGDSREIWRISGVHGRGYGNLWCLGDECAAEESRAL